MVDWVSGFITPRLCEEFGARFYDTGKLLKLGPGGEVVWEASGALELEGSYDNRLMVRSRDGFELYLSGNPVKTGATGVAPLAWATRGKGSGAGRDNPAGGGRPALEPRATAPR